MLFILSKCVTSPFCHVRFLPHNDMLL
uniref:Uncharacterized protein n=1 Tax=Lepeophtheirus salmonis TaxID=72036 RepID=A0A0K2T2L6_LEPSM